jgi:transcriptional regulator with XRE-family HTH domain
MESAALRSSRKHKGWSQARLAARLNVSQAYVNQLERGKRRFTAVLNRKLACVFDSPASLPLDESFRPEKNVDGDRLVGAFASLGYPGFTYVRSRSPKKNPAALLLTTLAQNHFDARILEGLPWLLLQYWNVNQEWLVEHARKFDLQNRLGFLVSLARRLSETDPRNPERTRALRALESTLDRSRLVREDSLGPAQTNAEKLWLKENRPAEAKHWNLLTDLRPQHLNYNAS